jgi:hypothetical protein
MGSSIAMSSALSAASHVVLADGVAGHRRVARLVRPLNQRQAAPRLDRDQASHAVFGRSGRIADGAIAGSRVERALRVDECSQRLRVVPGICTPPLADAWIEIVETMS